MSDETTDSPGIPGHGAADQFASPSHQLPASEGRDSGSLPPTEPSDKVVSDQTDADHVHAEALREQVDAALRQVYDPEIPVNIHELGLIYKVDIDQAHHVKVRMTLTSPACPAAQSLPVEVKTNVGGIDGVKQVDVDVVFDPPWTAEMMSEAAKLQLGML